ncbi:hypothetical protein LCGC14_0147400 [marine sediment metagenome]|uniref:Uncharacterized protein n=1 Tax=marine sediment metagenome TaxID=412755 RepID=A0A0F9Y1T7_9ZZZZ
MGRLGPGLITTISILVLATNSLAEDFPVGKRAVIDNKTVQAYSFEEYKQLRLFEEGYKLLRIENGTLKKRSELDSRISETKDGIIEVLDKDNERLGKYNEFLKEKVDELAEVEAEGVEDGMWLYLGWGGTCSFSFTTVLLIAIILL